MPQQCRHIFLDGHRCGSPTLRTREFCYHHHLTRRPVTVGTIPTTLDLPTPDCRAAVQVSIGEVLRLIALNQIDPRRAGLLLYGLSLAAQTLPREPRAINQEVGSATIDETILHPEHGLIAREANLIDPEDEPSLEQLLMEDWLRTSDQPENPKLAKLLGNDRFPAQPPAPQPAEPTPDPETTINLNAAAESISGPKACSIPARGTANPNRIKTLPVNQIESGFYPHTSPQMAQNQDFTTPPTPTPQPQNEKNPLPMYHGRMMKPVLSSLLLATLPALAQTAPAAKAPVKPAVHKAASACARLPEISPKVPALPAGLPCAKHLYTIAVTPPVVLENLAPFENAESLREILGIQEASSFSLDYIDIYPGTGASPAPKKWLTVEYTGYLTDGTKFDSSADHPGTPFSFVYGQVRGPGSAVAGWETGFDGMKVGAKRRLFVPFELGYGNSPKPNIPAKSMLIFDVKLVAVSDTDPNPKPAPKPPTAPIPGKGPTPTPINPSQAAKPATPVPATTTPPPPTTPKP